MLITVIGTQCVGKTTFIKDFLNEYKNFRQPDVDYRKLILEKRLKLNREGDYFSQNTLFNFISDQTVNYYLLSSMNCDYIFDRSVIDVVAYSKWLCENNNKSGFSLNKYEYMEQYAIKYSNMYDLIIYIPLEKNNHVKIVDDKFRDTDEEYRKQIDNNFRYLLKKYNNKNIVEICGSRTERIAQIKNIITSAI